MLFYSRYAKIIVSLHQFLEFMKTKKTILRPNLLNGIARHNPDMYVSNDFVFVRNICSAVTRPLLERMRTPQYVELGRILQVRSGTSTFRINLLPFHLHAGDVLVIPNNTYIEITEVSDDFNAQGMSFQTLPISFARCTVLHLFDVDFQRVGKYLDLIWEVLHKESFSMDTVEYLQSALFNDLQHLHLQTKQQTMKQLSHGEQIMQQFLNLVSEYGAKERHVAFYAERLLITPNHLSSIVRQQSGQTVMQWLNERTILQAKVLLKYSNLSCSAIAFELGFSEATLFSRFFRRETNLTPKEYKEK